MLLTTKKMERMCTLMWEKDTEIRPAVNRIRLESWNILTLLSDRCI